MMKREQIERGTGRILALALVISAAITLIAGASSLSAQMPGGQDDKDQTAVEDADVVLGTYDQRRVFTQYPKRDKLMQESQDAQKKMQEAQQDGDNEKVQQIQQQLQQKQQTIIQDFQDDVQEALPEVAEKSGVSAVAVQVQYTDDNTATKNVTDDVIEALGGDPDDAPTMQVPGR